MKKIIKLFAFIFMFVLVTKNVYAAEANCVYQSASFGKITIIYRDTKLSYKFEPSMGFYKENEIKVNAGDLTNSDGTLKCPDKILFNYTSYDESQIYVNFSFDNTNNRYTMNAPLTDKTITNYSPNATDNEKDVVCKYGSNVLTFNRTTKKVSVSLADSSKEILAPISYQSLEKYNNECPPDFCILDLQENNLVQINFGGTGNCISKTVAVNSKDPNSEKNNVTTNNNTVKIQKSNELSCDKIKELTDPIWKWLMIIGPTLALVLGVLDLLKAVASGDDKTVKKSMSDFGKRLGLAALLLMLPTIVNLIIGLVEFGDLTICL